MAIPNDVTTKLSAVGGILLCVGGLLTGTMDMTTAIGGIIASLAVFGLGRKLERSAVNAEKTVEVLKVTAVETGVPPSKVEAVTATPAEKKEEPYGRP